MKGIIMHKTEQSKEQNGNLLKKEAQLETVLSAGQDQDKTNFTFSDLWNRHRNSRSASDMMRRGNLN